MEKVKSGELKQAVAVSEYEKEMIARGLQEVKDSVENTYMLLDWNKFKESPIFTKGIERAE